MKHTVAVVVSLACSASHADTMTVRTYARDPGLEVSREPPAPPPALSTQR